MRAFIAVDIASDVRSAIEQLVHKIKGRVRGARWVSPENLHLTLRFLGESDETTVSAVSETVVAATRHHPPFALDFRGIGVFPSTKRPRVLWVGVSNPPETLLKLQNELEAAARGHGYEAEGRRFSPHLTLARFRKPEFDPGIAELVREFGEHPFGNSAVGELVLYRSILRPTGAEYDAVRRFPLGLSGDRG